MTAPYPTLFGCEPGTGGDTIVLGTPYDRGSALTVSGCAEAPSRLRALSAPGDVQMRHFGLFAHDGRRLVEPSAVSDLGDLPFRPSQSDSEYLDFVANAVRLVAVEGKRPFLLGGDHLVTLAALRGIGAAGLVPQVLQLDAHTDTGIVKPKDLPTHSTFVAYLVAEGLVSRVVQVGVRGVAGAAIELPLGVRCATVDSALELLDPGAPLYLTIDTDAFDPSVAPGVSYPEARGLSLDDLSTLLAGLAGRRFDLVGLDWTEFNPRFDSLNGLTGRFVVTGLASLLEFCSTRGRPHARAAARATR